MLHFFLCLLNPQALRQSAIVRLFQPPDWDSQVCQWLWTWSDLCQSHSFAQSLLLSRTFLISLLQWFKLIFQLSFSGSKRYFKMISLKNLEGLWSWDKISIKVTRKSLTSAKNKIPISLISKNFQQFSILKIFLKIFIIFSRLKKNAKNPRDFFYLFILHSIYSLKFFFFCYLKLIKLAYIKPAKT
jgi:hypothetical protein